MIYRTRPTERDDAGREQTTGLGIGQ